MRSSGGMRAWNSVGRIACAVALFGAPMFGLPRWGYAEEELRIALVSNAASVEVAGIQLRLFDGETGALIASWPGLHETTLRRGGDGINAEGASPVTKPSAGAGAQVLSAKTAAVVGATSPKASSVAARGVRRLIVEAKDGIRVAGGLYLGRLEIVPDPGARAGDRLLVINRLPLEVYLLGIIGSEMNPTWPLDALKAQAVAARTYAMQRRMMRRAANKAYDLESTVLSQVYKGADQIRPLVIQAVKETRGEVLSYRHDLVEALFHSTCGGHTASAEEVFGREIPYLVERPCAWCRESTRYRWHVAVPLDEVSKKLNAARLLRSSVNNVERDSDDGDVLIEVRGAKDKRLKPREVRAAVGYTRLFSNRFVAETSGHKVVFDGQGFGHGVGMCQWGARGMALAGYTYREILVQYYKGASIKRLY
ncbi:MAG: SpoIID/LytB domain-containing protein [Deltaproteobacteria bacterium]|nr:SpoIID/LytB domain-containing protein [Deltaproteobacteria bacterium]